MTAYTDDDCRPLTAGELAYIQMLSDDLDYKTICIRQGITYNYLLTKLSSLRIRMGVRTNPGMVSVAIACGLVEANKSNLAQAGKEVRIK